VGHHIQRKARRAIGSSARGRTSLGGAHGNAWPNLAPPKQKVTRHGDLQPRRRKMASTLEIIGYSLIFHPVHAAAIAVFLYHAVAALVRERRSARCSAITTGVLAVRSAPGLSGRASR